MLLKNTIREEVSIEPFWPAVPSHPLPPRTDRHGEEPDPDLRLLSAQVRRPTCDTFPAVTKSRKRLMIVAKSAHDSHPAASLTFM